MSEAAAPATPVWIDGTLIAADAATVPLADRGFTLGDGVFETLLWRHDGPEPGPQRFMAHMARLAHAASSLGLCEGLRPDWLHAGIDAICQGAGADQAVRITLSRGVAPRGLRLPENPQPRFVITASPHSPVGPVRNLVRTGVGRAAGAPSARFKTLSYIDNVEALRQARAAGGDDGLLLGRDGQPVCATAANLIVARDGEVLTPLVTEGALPGILRGAVLSTGLVCEARLVWADLDASDAIITTNALTGPRPVMAFEGRILPRSVDLAMRLARALDEASE